MASSRKSNGATSEAASASAGVGESAGIRSETSPRPLRVLRVEDQPADAQLVQDLLEESEDVQIEVDHVTRLDAAVDRMSDEDCDLVLLDLSLPDGYGSFTIDFAAQFARQLPVVILTGIEDDSLARMAIQAGAADYICKSVLSEVQLAKTIESAVERQRRLDRLMGLSLDRVVSGTNDSLHDPVTGLMSEALFKDRLEHTLACSERNQSPFTPRPCACPWPCA
jgi:DNA-binding NarL/FixJ family response regulator